MSKRRVPKKIRTLTTRYIELLNERKMTEADKVREKIREGLKSIPWHKGYYNALEGIATALKSKSNQYLYINRIDPRDKKRMRQLQKEFSTQSRSPLQGDFDKGYFTAWLEYLRILKLQEESTGTLTDYLPST
jgi:hypothetical protein